MLGESGVSYSTLYEKVKVKKEKTSLLQAMEAHRVVRG
jgi:hypothetical protein